MAERPLGKLNSYLFLVDRGVTLLAVLL